MKDIDKAYEVIAKSLDLSVEDVRDVITQLAVRAGRLMTWRGFDLTKLTPPERVQVLYADKIAANTMHTGVIYSDNRQLYRDLKNWLNTPSKPVPEGFYVPSKSEWLACERAKRDQRSRSLAKKL